MMINSRTYIAIPPGETIKEQLSDRDLSQKTFAEKMNLSEKDTEDLLNGDIILTPEIASRLENVLGIPVVFWINLESLYRSDIEKVQEENQRDAKIKMSRKRSAQANISR